MKYMLQIYLGDSMDRIARLPRDEQQPVYDQYRALTQAPGLIDAHQLEPAETATTVRVLDGQAITTAAGPFAGAREPLGGYYLIEADHPAAAIEFAARIPAARLGGAIEIRPVIDR